MPTFQYMAANNRRNPLKGHSRNSRVMHQHFGKRKALAIRRKTARKITYGLLPVLQKANWVGKRGPAGIKVKRIRKKSDLERELAVFIYFEPAKRLELIALRLYHGAEIITIWGPPLRSRRAFSTVVRCGKKR